MHASKRKTRNLYLALTITGLILLFLWPSLVAAMPLTAQHQLERAWRLAVDIGSYHYRSTVVQTDHPTADLRNAGRSAHVTHVSAQGAVDLSNKAMSMKLWTAGIDKDGIEVKVENGKAYGRMNAAGGWVEISDPSQIFAPGGDPLGFLVAAENIQAMDAEEQSLTTAGPTLDDVIDNPHLLSAKTYQLYKFDINGVRYAEYVRRQLEGGMREQGELPPNITLGVIRHYVHMKGQGEIWLDDDGLPVQQVIRMQFPAERGTLHWTENKVTTTFSQWDKAEVYHQLFWAIPRLVDDPTLLTTDPLSLLPSPRAFLPNPQWFTATNVEQSGLLLGLGLLLAALVVMVYTHRRSPQFYAGLSAVVVVLMLTTPLINANHALAFAERQQTRAIEQQFETQQQMEASRAGMARRDFNPLVDPLVGSNASLDTLSGGNGQSTPSQPPPARGRSQYLPSSGGGGGFFEGNDQSTPSQPPPARGRSQNLPPSGGDRGGESMAPTQMSALEPARGRSQNLPPSGGDRGGESMAPTQMSASPLPGSSDQIPPSGELGGPSSATNLKTLPSEAPPSLLLKGSEPPRPLSARFMIPTLQSTCVLTTGGDCDSDGLADDIELYELGTDPEDVDTDNDGISDKAEVEGFAYGGTQWYLNPSDPDSNGDGVLDGAACPGLADVEGDTVVSPTGSSCLNSDSDSTPDVFDYDDDADGVPDWVDSAPLDVAGPFNATGNPLAFNLTLNSNGEPIFVDFEVRPTNPDHLFYTKQVLDWPDDDTTGQWTKNSDTTFADLDDYDSGDGDMMLNPLLEFEITYDAGNPTAGLPITDSVSIGSITDYSDLSWIDTEALSEWGISVNEGDTDSTMLLWAPLSVMEDDNGDTPVAWSGRMFYLPQTAQTTLGNAQTVRLVWMIEGIIDTCTAPSDSDYDTYCADDSNWSSSVQIMQTYYDEFTLTGLTVHEDHGGQLNIIAEPSGLGHSSYDDYLWHLADSLQETFVRGQQKPGGGRFSVDDIATFTTTWGVSGLSFTTKTLEDQRDLADISGEDNLSILNSVHAGAAISDTASLLYAGEETNRIAVLSDDAASISGSSVSVDMTQIDQTTSAIVRLSPFQYQGAGVWEDMSLDDYQTELAADLESVFTDAQLDALLAANGETVTDYTLARDGAISLAQGYVLSLIIGLSGLVELNGTDVNSDTFTNDDLILSGEVAVTLVQHMLSEMQAYYASTSVVTALATASDTSTDAANALSAAFAESQADILDALGSARQGDISSGLSLALQQLGNYYKTVDVDTSNFTDYASLSQQFYVSTVNSLDVGWATVYSNGKYMWGLGNAIWGLKVMQGTAGVVSANASILVKMWNSAKVWAVVGFVVTAAIALIMFLTGDYDNQLEYDAAAVKFAVSIIVYAIVALITAIPGVGFLITGLVAAIDGLMALICQLVGVEPGSSFDTWFCSGITGAVIRALTLLFSDQLILVDLDNDDRLDVSFSSPAVVQKTNNDGYLIGNQLSISATITNTISLNEPTVGENLLILTSFSTSELKDRMRRSTFAYALQSSKTDHHSDLEWGDKSRWSDNNDTMTFEVSGSGLFSGAGINHTTDLYLTESYNVLGLTCGGFIVAFSCSNEPIRDSVHTFIGEDMAFDILPASLDGFRSLTAASDGGYRLAWDRQFPALTDADGDGVPLTNDPDDTLPDTDGDGLTDLWELDNGFDATFVGGDGDSDGLSDYWEAFYGTDPYLADTDNDGLIDGDEFFHTQSLNPYIDDDTTWTGGWLFTYDFDSSDNALKTRVSASPIDADTDSDNVTDRLEFVYGYNPTVPQDLNVLSLSASASPSLVGVGGTVAYTATVKNELDSRTARGLLEAEFPVDTTQNVETFVLANLEETTLNGTVTAPSVAQTIETSVTIRAGAIIEDPDAEDDSANLVAQYQFNESEPTSACTGILNCSGAYSFVDSSRNDHDAVCEKDWDGSYSVDCPVANGSYLEFTGVLDDSPNYYTPVARIEADDDFKLDSFSFEVWVKPTTQENHPQNILNKYGDFTLGIKANGMTPFFSLQNSSCSNGTGSDTTINGSINLDKNAWNQLIVTYNDDTNVLTLYVNGQNGGSAITDSCMATGLNERITIGAMDQTELNAQYGLSWTPPAFESDTNYYYYGYYTTESFAFIGGMNKLQIFDADLSVSEVEDLYSKGNRALEFKFDEPPGATAFADSSGNALEATCSSACPQSGRSGLADQALYMDGSDAVTLVPGTTLFNGGDTLGINGDLDYTIMAWVKPTVTYPVSDDATLFGFTTQGIDKNGYPYFGSTSQGRLTASTAVQPDQWQHLAWRFEADTGARTIFINGVPQGTDTGKGTVGSFFGVYAIGFDYEGWLDNLVIFSSALSQAEIEAAMQESPVLNLHLDEDLDTTSFSDEAPASNPATCSGSGCPQAGADGWMREAPVFDGDDTLTIAASDDLQVSDFSLSMWVKPTKTKSSNQWLIRKDNSSGYNRNYALRIESNSMTVRFFIQNSCYNYSAGWKYFDSQGELLENQWNNIIATYDNDRNEMALYINGALDTEYTPSYTGICSNSQPITIGEGFEGSIDEVAVYGGRLSSLDTQAIYDYQSAWYDTVQQVPVIIDTAPPAITLGDFTELRLESTMLAVTVVDDDSYLSRIASVNVTVTPPAGGGSAYTESASGSGDGDWLYYFSPTVSGQYTIEFSATDNAGNSTSSSTVVNVDNTPPTVEIDAGLTSTILTTSEPITSGADTLALTGAFSDGGSPASGVVTNSLTIDIRDWQGVSVQGSEAADATGSATWQVDYPFVSPPYGRYDVQAQAEDAAGNVMSGTIGAIAVDALGPTADVVAGTVVISSAMPIVSGTVMDVPFSGNSRRLHLHFEESEPPFVDGSLRQANATCSGSECPSAGQSGQLGLAADFDGSDVLTTVNILDPADTSFTAMAWFNLDSASGTLLSERDGDGTGRTWLAVDGGQVTSDLGGASLTVPTAVGSGGWHHAAVTYDGDLLRLYLDGSLAISATRTIEAADGEMVIGANKNEGDHFSGRIDELAIYDRAFSDDEIYSIANPLDTGIDSAEIRLRHFNGNPWPDIDPDGFMMYLPLDDEDGATDFNTYSIYSYTVTCTECTTNGATGAVDQAVYFDGTSHLEVSNEEFFDFENEVSISIWIKSDDSRSDFGPQYATIVDKEGAYALNQYLQTGRINFYTFHPKGSNPVGANHTLLGSANLADGEWHHVVATYDGQTKSLYVDGVLDVADDVTDTVNPLLGQFDEPLWLGADSLVSNHQRDYVGYLDDVTLFERSLTEDEVQSLDDGVWRDVTLDATDSNYTTWQYSLPDSIEGPYNIDLRASDSLGNTNILPARWIGMIDLAEPRPTLTYTHIISNYYQAGCRAEDLNITDEEWDCPITGDLTAELQDADWYLDFVSPQTRTKAYASDQETYTGGDSALMTACDLVNNCITLAVSATELSEVNTILTPTTTTVLTGITPIAITGVSRSDSGLQSLEVWANDTTIYTTTWTTNTGESLWDFDWTPPGGGVYTLTTTMLNGLNEPVTDPEPTVITVVGPYLTLTKSVTPTTVLEPNDTITYTLVLSNGGNFTATNIVITDVLPINVDGDDLSESVSQLAPGQAVSYTIPATITSFISDTVINTAYFSETQHSGQSSVTSRQCAAEFEVTTDADDFSNPPYGSLRYAIENSCDGATITFSDDFTITLRFLSVDKGLTIDAAGHTVVLDGGSYGSGLFSIYDHTSPVTLTHLTMINGATEGAVFDFGGPGSVTIQDSAILDNYAYGSLIDNNTDLQIINSSLVNNEGDDGSVIYNRNGASLLLENSTLSGNTSNTEIINNAAGSVMTVTYVTLAENVNRPTIRNAGTLLVENSLVAGNDSDCVDSGTATDGGYNLLVIDSGCPATQITTQFIDASDLFSTILAPLDSYGGDSQTYALQVGSPAIDAIPAGLNACGTDLTTDQRGLPRPMFDQCDIGAFEAQGYVLTVTGGLSQTGYINAAFGEPLEVTLTNPYSEPVGIGGDITFTAPVTGAGLTSQTFTVGVDSSDVASATVIANDTTGSYTVTATSKGIDNTVTFSLTNALPPVDLWLTKMVNPVAALPGQPVTYTLIFSNVSAYTATGIIITDIVPPEIEPLAVPTAAVDAGVTITPTTGISYAWTVSDLGPGQGGVITITGQVSSSLVSGGAVINRASITATVDLTPTNNSVAAGLVVDNLAPQVGPIASQTISETHTLTFTLPAADPNGDTDLTYELIAGATGDAAVNSSSGLFSWTPAEVDGPGIFTFTVLVTDTGGLTGTADFTVTVTEVNTAPLLAVIPNQTITETVELTFTVQATDSDVPSQTLSYGLGADAPPGATIDSSGRVAWTPAEGDGGSVFVFTVLVTDTGSLTDSQSVQVSVISANAAPVMTAGSLVTVTMTEDSTPSPFSLTLYATDVDLPGDMLTWSLPADPANGTALVSGTGLSQTVAYTPTADYNGFDSFSVAVSDGSLTDTVLVSVTVLAVNDQPAFVSLGDQTTAPLTNTQQTLAGWAPSGGFDFGPADEEATQSVQDFLVLVTNGTGLFSQYPTVSSDGTLRYTPNGSSGTADVSVWLQDDGGVAYGGLDISEPVTFTITIPRGTEYSLIASTGVITEGDSGSQTITFTVSRIGDTDLPSQINYSLGGSASIDSDYGNLGGSAGVLDLSGVITFAAGEISKTVTLDVFGDRVDESLVLGGGAITNAIQIDSETVILSLTNGTYTTEPDVTYSAGVTIEDDDTAAIILTESDGSTDVDEFGPTSDSYSLQLTSVPAETVTITVAPDGQLDVGSGPGVPIDLTFAADLTALDPQTVTVTAVNDTLVEGPHSGTIKHTVSSSDLVYPTLVVSDVVASILDDDLLPTLVISDVTVAEDVGTAVISLTLSGRNVYGAGVTYAFSDGSADSSDYSATNGSLTWPANTSGTQTIAALITDDSYGESAETINITLSTPLTATLVDGSGVITITDNDPDPNLDIAKTVTLSGTTAWPGDPVTYTLVISNSGGSVDNVTVADMLPAALDGQDFTWTGVITANAAVTHTVVATIDTDVGYGTFILNTATASHALSFDSATAGFATIDDTMPPSLTAARLISPTGTLTDTRRPTFAWEGFTDDISGVISYTLLISSSNDSVSLQSITTAAAMQPVFTPTVDLATGVYTWTVRAYDAAGNASAYVSPAATFTITQGDIFLPLILRRSVPGPDLVVDSVTATASQVTVTIRNAGDETVTDSFWVDAYFNPSQEPTLNQPWNTIAPAGAVWGVTKPLAPSESLTLTVGDAYYFGPPDSSASFPVGATVYVYVDSVNHNTSYGNVKEGNESNNLSAPVISTAGDNSVALPNVAAPASRAGLPGR